MRRPAHDQLTVAGLSLVYAAAMGIGLHYSSRFPWLAELAIPYLPLPVGAVGALFLIWGRLALRSHHDD